MPENVERSVASHYAATGLVQRIEEGLAALGLAEGPVPCERLAPVDEFHVGGRAATAHAVGLMGLTGTEHVLDVGCGVGGAARYLAAQLGCRVTGVDLTPDFVDAARMLTLRTGLADRVRFEVASALDMPFSAATFDAALTFHVAMNIPDRAGLYAEVARVLATGAVFCVYDVMRGPGPEPVYPLPWADDPSVSHLTTPDETAHLLSEAGFKLLEREDRSDAGIEFFRERLAVPPGAAPPLGLHLVVGGDMRRKFVNVLAGLEQQALRTVVMVARKS